MASNISPEPRTTFPACSLEFSLTRATSKAAANAQAAYKSITEAGMPSPSQFPTTPDPLLHGGPTLYILRGVDIKTPVSNALPPTHYLIVRQIEHLQSDSHSNMNIEIDGRDERTGETPRAMAFRNDITRGAARNFHRVFFDDSFRAETVKSDSTLRPCPTYESGFMAFCPQLRFSKQEFLM